ncbi:MAG: hypothetical protein LBE91_00380 [Tannerella sp.]|nr:hypothetical protein [Tannerella sp.]
MDQFKLKQSNETLQSYFANVENERFQNALYGHWSVEKVDGNEYVTPQSFCWLYCWANTGMGSDRTKKTAEIVFNNAFDFSFQQVDSDRLHYLARKLRYKKLLNQQEKNQLLKLIS